MYRKDDANQLKFKDFYLPFSGQLRGDNRWVVLSKHIPWDKIEQTRSIVTMIIVDIARSMEFGFPAQSLADRRK